MADPRQHLGECAVIACATHRGLTALLDDRSAITQANRHGVQSRDTLWLVIEAYWTLPDFDRERAIRVVDDLVATGMYLPIAVLLLTRCPSSVQLSRDQCA